MNVTLESHVAVPESVMFRRLGQESVLLDLASATYFGLDDVGTRFWEALVAHGSLSHAYITLLETYDVSDATLRAELLRLTGELAAAGLLQIRDA